MTTMNTTAKAPILEGRGLRKTYRMGRRNRVEALRGVDIRIDAGEMVAIMGPSGSGKSTLMHLLGLLHAPDADGHGDPGGQGGPRAPEGLGGPAVRPALCFDGRDTLTLGEAERTRIRARRMGFVFQDFNLVPTLTAAENVMLACAYAGVTGSPARRAAADALALVGLGDRGGHRPAELSGGEQQRVAIARALVNRPALVLADEPTGNLDSERSAEILALLRRSNREHGTTVILVTHDEEVGAACDRVIHVRDGRIREAVPVSPSAAASAADRRPVRVQGTWETAPGSTVAQTAAPASDRAAASA